MRYLLTFLSFLALAFGGALLGANSVNATSAYDGLIGDSVSSVSPYEYNSGICEAPIPFTQTDVNDIFGPLTGQYSQYHMGVIPNGFYVNFNREQNALSYVDQLKSDWQSKTYYSVVQVLRLDMTSTNYRSLSITFTNDPTGNIEFKTSGSTQYLDYVPSPGYWTRTVYIIPESYPQYDNGCGGYVQGVSYPMTGSSSHIMSSSDIVINQPFFIQGNIQYPSGYAGLIPPSEPSQPPVQSDYVPNWYVSTASDWKADIHDQNFNTIDSNPFLCSEDLAPVLNYEIWNRTGGSETLLDTGSQSATAQITYQFEKVNEDRDYRIVGWYDCGEPPEMQFSQSGYRDFTILRSGSLEVVGLSSCITSDFPFFDLNSCIVGINETLAILSFNALNINNSSLANTANNANPNSCYTMQVLDDWISKPGEVLCPSFSQTVRNTVTPFVTFALGAAVFYFISRGRAQVI